MQSSEDRVPISEWERQARALLEQVNRTRRAVVVTENGTARAVLQDPQSYEQMRQALVWLQLIAQAEADMQAGQTQPADQVFRELLAQLPVLPR